MTDNDLIARAEVFLAIPYQDLTDVKDFWNTVRKLVRDLLAALKAEQAENERLRGIVYRTAHNHEATK